MFAYYFFIDSKDGIYLDAVKQQLNCSKVIHIDFYELEKYYSYRNLRLIEKNNIISQFLEEVNETVKNYMPEITGHKKLLLQCNYVHQTILNILKQLDIRSFCFLYETLQVNDIETTI